MLKNVKNMTYKLFQNVLNYFYLFKKINPKSGRIKLATNTKAAVIASYFILDLRKPNWVF